MGTVDTFARSLDHFVLVVQDLEAGSATYRRLGFHVRPIAKHIEIGTSNCVIHFPRTYLELFWPGVRDRLIPEGVGRLLAPYSERLAFGEGMAHVSLDSPGLDIDRRVMQERGLAPEPTLNARRKIIRPDGMEDETASSCFYMWRSDNRYLSLFLSEHRRPETIFIPEYENHANGALDVTRIVFMSADPAGDIDYFSRLFGKPPDHRHADGFEMTGARGDVTEVLTPEAARRRYGEHLQAEVPGPFRGLCVAMHFSSRSLAATREYLRTRSIDHSGFGDGVVIPAAAACGCTIVFEPRS